MPILIIKMVFILGVPVLAGAIFYKCLFPGENPFSPGSLSVSFGAGMGILGQVMLYTGMFHRGINILNVTFWMGTAAAVCLLVYLRKCVLKKPAAVPDTGRTLPGARASLAVKVLAACATVYIATYVFYVFMHALTLPVFGWDTIASAGFKAKVIFNERSIRHLKYFPNASFPLQLPFMMAWFNIVLGKWNDQYVKIFFPLVFMSFVIVFYGFLRKCTTRMWALLGVALLFSSNLFIAHGTISYRDLLMLYYNVCCIMFLLEWSRTKDDSYLVLTSFFAGFGASTKLEGYVYVLVYILLFTMFLAMKNELRKGLAAKCVKFSVPALSMSLPFVLYKAFNGVMVNQKFVIDTSIDYLSRIISTLLRFNESLFLTANWNILWFIMIVSSLANYKKFRADLKITALAVSVLAFFAIHICVAVFTVNYEQLLATVTLPRVILHFFPLSVLLIVLLNYRAEV